MSIIAQTASAAEVNTGMLLSVAKPLLAIVPFVIYTRIAGSKFDKDSRYYQINPARWAMIFAVAPLVAVLVVLSVPYFWVGWPLSVLILAGTLLGYVVYRNQRVPEADRYSLGAFKFGESIQARKEAAALRSARLRFMDPSKRELPVPIKEDPLHAVHLTVEALIEPAIEGRATRLDLAPTPQGFVPTQVVDGVRFRREGLPPDVATAAIDYVKGLAGLEVGERRKRQAADFWVVSGETLIKASVAVSGGSSGQSLRIDFDREKRLSRPFDTLGLLESQVKILNPLVQLGERRGVVLVAAAPGQGLTSLCYSLVARHDAFTCNVKSLEKQIELRVDGVDQQLYNPANPAVDYAAQLQSIIRRGPDIVLVGDISEPRVGQIISSASNSDMLFYVAVPVPVAPGAEVGAALREWFRSAADLKAGAAPLRAVITQRLVRKLCEYCRQPHPRSADLAKRLGASSGAAPTLFAASGKVQVKNRVEACPVCKGSGFLGQIGVHEVVGFDDETRALLAANDANGAYTTARRTTKAPSLQDSGLARVRDGTTSIEEFQRVLAPPKSPPPSSGATPSAAPAAPAV